MAEVMIYQGKSALLLAVFYIFYRLLLSKETLHRLNRIVLLGAVLLSFILPCCAITITKITKIKLVLSDLVVYDGPLMGDAEIQVDVTEPLWIYWGCVIIALGALVVLLHFIVSICNVMKIIRTGESRKLESGEVLVITDTDMAPFSWMKWIVLSRADFESGYTQFLAHERAHISLKHSWDIVFIYIVAAFQWFNPVIWMLKSDLCAIHEFEADDAVLNNGVDIKGYQYLLIRKAVDKCGYPIANSFSYSALKQRIDMMMHRKSPRRRVWKAFYIIPIVCVTLAATAQKKVSYYYEGNEGWIPFVPVSEGIGDRKKIDGFKLYSASDWAKDITYEEYSKIHPGSHRYNFVEHSIVGKRYLHLFTEDYNAIIHLSKCAKTTYINDKNLEWVNEKTKVFVDGVMDNYEGYLRTLKFYGSRILEIEYYRYPQNIMQNFIGNGYVNVIYKK